MVKFGHALHHGGLDEVMATLSALRAAEPSPDAAGPIANALTMAAHVSYNTGQSSLAADILPRIQRIVEPIRERDPLARAWMDAANAYYAPMVKEEPWEGVRWAEASRASFMEISHRRGMLFVQVFLGLNLWILGAYERAESEFLGAIVMDSKFGLISGTFFLVQVLSDRGSLSDARSFAPAALSFAATAPASTKPLRALTRRRRASSPRRRASSQ
jgi:eukaryotic-like serine/threonine-protein kinase